MTKWINSLTRNQWNRLGLAISSTMFPIGALLITGAILGHWYGTLMVACGLVLVFILFLLAGYLKSKR